MTEKAAEAAAWLNAYIKTDSCHKVLFSDDKDGDYGEDWMWLDDICQRAADTIERLAADLERVTKERDAAIKDIPRACGYCRDFLGEDKLPHCENWSCKNVSGTNTEWQWRGVQED